MPTLSEGTGDGVSADASASPVGCDSAMRYFFVFAAFAFSFFSVW